MKQIFWYILLIVLWTIAGITTLIAGPSRFTYAVVWICLLCEYGLKIISDQNDNNDRFVI